MFVKIEGVDHVVKFQHDSQGEVALNKAGKQIRVNRYSKAIISELKEANKEKVKGVGTSLCHSLDNFDKEKGRQKALSRALEAGNFSKTARTIFWETYRNWKKERF
jgi:hypothetical protein